MRCVILSILYFICLLDTNKALTFKSLTGIKLNGFVMDTKINIGPQMCVRQCSVIGGCKSVNYEKRKFICEINLSNSSLSPGDLSNAEGYDFIEEIYPSQDETLECHLNNSCPVRARCTDLTSGGHVCNISVSVQECLTMPDCWVKKSFSYDSVFNSCYGDQYVKQTSYSVGKYVGVILCNQQGSRYKLFLADSLDSRFLNIGDSSGHGQDHCELVGGVESNAVMAKDYSSFYSTSGYYRRSFGENFQRGSIGYRSSHRFFCSWQECGVNIPGMAIVIQATEEQSR